MSTLLASHRQALASVAALCEGQTALLRATELACRMGGGEGRRETYLRQMGLLCMQQKLLASLHVARSDDRHVAPARRASRTSTRLELRAGPAPAPGVAGRGTGFGAA